jgi:adenylate cyclase
MSAHARRLATLLDELKRRRVFRVATMYAAFSLGVVYAADVILPRVAAPDWTVTLVIVLAGLGFIASVVLAWAFDVTPDGVVRASQAVASIAVAAPVHAADDPGATAVAARSPSAAGIEAVARDRRAIAVLPFENMSREVDNDYFSDGISEEIIHALARLPELRVAGRTSAFTFKGRHEDLRAVGRQLNVGTVLEGSVRQVGSRVRITAQLIDANDGYHLWSERYDRDLHDIFQIQDEIARAIAAQLAVELAAPGDAPLVARHPDNPVAYARYLEGRHHMSQLMDPGATRAIAAFRAALDVAPDYGLAYAAMAECEIIRGIINDEPYAGAPSRARDAALRAIALDDTVAEAHAALGAVLTYYDMEWDAAARSFARALDLGPGSAWTHTWYGDLLGITGRLDEAIAEARRALAIEPLAPLVRWNVIQNLWFGGHLDEADAEARATLELFPDAYFPHFFLGMTALSRGAEGAAIAALEETLARLGRSPLVLGYLVATLHHFGHEQRAATLYEEIRQRAESEHVSAGVFVLVNVARGDTAEAVRWLRAGRAQRDGTFSQLKTVLRAMPLRIEPDLAAEFDRLGFR